MRSPPLWSKTPVTPLTDGSAPSAPSRGTLRALGGSTFAPTLLAELGLGAMLPIFALSVLAMGHPATWGAATVVMYSLGRICGSAVGGRLAARRGPHAAALVTLGLLAAGAVACGLSSTLAPFLAGTALVGLGHAAYHVARQGQIGDQVPAHFRARALTSLAGAWRISNFVGPLVGAAVISAWGLSMAYLCAAAAVVAGGMVLLVSPEWRGRVAPPPQEHVTTADVLRGSMPVLRTLGVAVMLTGALRTARLAVIPLWGAHVGLSDHTISIIFAASAAVDMLLFYPAGVVMDRWGRAWTAIPSTLLLAAGTVALTMTTGAAGVVVAAMVLGLGNGWGSGVLMTLGADVAPVRGRDMFIGSWMILQDIGGAAGPAIVAAGAAVTLPLGLWIVGGAGFVTAGALYAWIPPWRRPAPEPTT